MAYYPNFNSVEGEELENLNAKHGHSAADETFVSQTTSQVPTKKKDKNRGYMIFSVSLSCLEKVRIQTWPLIPHAVPYWL